MMCVRRVVQRLRDNETAGEELQKQLREEAEGLKQSPVTQVGEGGRRNGGGFFGGAGESVELCGSAGFAEIRGLDEGIRVSMKCKNVCGDSGDWTDVVCLSNVVRENRRTWGK